MCKNLLTITQCTIIIKSAERNVCKKTAKAERRIIMKKKFFAIAAIALLSVMCLSMFAACITDVDGKTYVFESIRIELDDEAESTAEEMGMDIDKFTDYLLEQSGIEEMFSSIEISFSNGKMTMTDGENSGVPVDYEQKGMIITIDGMTDQTDEMTEEVSFTITVSGSKLVMEPNMEMEGIEGLEGIDAFKIIFKQK